MRGRIIILAGISLIVLGCSSDLEPSNPVMKTPSGAVDLALKAELLYGKGIRIGWEEPGIPEISGFRLYRGAPGQGCDELAALADVSADVTEHVDLDVVPDRAYSYCITVTRGEEETSRIDAPTAEVTFRAPSFVLNRGKYLAISKSVSLRIEYHSNLFEPKQIVVRIGSIETLIPFSEETNVSIGDSNGPVTVELMLEDAGGQRTSPVSQDLYLCTAAVSDNDDDGYPSEENIPDECPGLKNDCDDHDEKIHPGATEVCDGKDNDCDGEYDEDFDGDGDHYTTCGTLTTDGSSVAADCNDSNAGISPGTAELCDGKDQDCDGEYDEDFDGDGDHYTTCGTLTTDGSAVTVDCNDADYSIQVGCHPVPDTNQLTCYDIGSALASCPGTAGGPSCSSTLFCGQDAQYGWDTTHDESERFDRYEPVSGSGEYVILDNLTGLLWQGCAAGLSGSGCSVGSSSSKTWSGAMSYCQDLVWAGFDDWYLPDAHELDGIVDAGRYDPAIDPDAFPATPLSWFWSSSSYASDPSSAWSVSFNNGSVHYYDEGRSRKVRCVRAGP